MRWKGKPSGQRRGVRTTGGPSEGEAEDPGLKRNTHVCWVALLFGLEGCGAVGRGGRNWPQGSAPGKQAGCRGEAWTEGPGMMNQERPGPVAMVTQCENKLYTHIYTSLSVLIHARKHAKPNALFL